jgi:hypothetical protein
VWHPLGPTLTEALSRHFEHVSRIVRPIDGLAGVRPLAKLLAVIPVGFALTRNALSSAAKNAGDGPAQPMPPSWPYRFQPKPVGQSR